MAETKNCELVQVMGRRWDTSRPSFFAAPEGMSLENIVLQSIESAYRDKIYNKAQRRVLLKYARCRLNGREIDRKYWKEVFPQKGDRIEILHGVRGGGGGGGGKNPLATILSVLVVVVAAVATFWAGGAGAAIPFGLTAAQFSTGVGLLAAGALMAINALFPAKQPSLGGIGGGGDAAKESPTYSINGGKNAHNVDGFVPLVLGRHRQTPPLGAKSWTMWQGEDQYFNMLVVWGHSDVVVSDFKIGDTDLSKFEDVTHVFHQSTTGGGLKYFGWQYNEESVGATLDTDWTVRTVGEGTALSIDVEFPGGLCNINQKNGNKERRTIELEVQYKPTSGGSWTGFATKIEKSFSGKTLTWSQSDIDGTVSVFYKDGGVQAVPRGQSVSGGIQIYPASGLQYIYGCGVSCEPSGSKMKVTVQPGVFKKSGKVYTVGGAKSGKFYSYDSDGYISMDLYKGGKAQTLTIDSSLAIGVSEAGNVHKGSGFRNLWPSKSSGVSGGGVSWSRDKHYYYGAWYDDDYYGWSYTGWKAEVGGGSFTVEGNGRASVSNSKQKQFVRNYMVTNLAMKSWDVRVRRVTGKSDSSYVIDDCVWATMRAIVQKPAFDTPVPICVSELRIRASEQLSGYVTEFSGMCVSKIPDWTPQTVQTVNGKQTTVPGHWNTWRETSNPASILRYVLTSKHSLIKPFAASRLDNASIVALWNWCEKNDYRFDFIADSEENLWSRLVQVLAPAMAGPTTDVDGLWGAVIDQPNKTVRQLFTPRNSWNMQIQRGFAKLPDALRVKFIDETDDWKQKEGFVYNDGFNKDGSGGNSKANDVVEWSFEGVTNWNRMYKLARYHLAQLLHRQMTVTINTDWEWLAVHRGDLVGLSSDVMMNAFGTARIIRKVYRTSETTDAYSDTYINENIVEYTDSDAVEERFGPGDAIPSGAAFIGVEIDDAIYYTSPSPARYGIAVRNATGAVNILEITPQYGEESSVLYFADRSQAERVAPNFGDLVSVSLLGSEYEEYLVASITPSDNMSAQITLVPYKTAEIMRAANAPIPAYEAPVVLDAVKGAQDLPTPSLRACVSDERVAQVSASGAVQICIGATWALPPTTENLPYFTIELNATREDTGGEITGTSTNAEEYAVAPGAIVGKKYFCKIRIHDPVTGRASAWSNVVTHTVAGLVAPPPAPQNVRVSTVYPHGIKLTWDEVQVIDLHHYKITGATEGQTKGKETEYVYVPTSQSGELTYNVWSVDTTDHVSTSPGTATISVSPPKKPIIQLARLENEGIVLQYGSAEGTWPVAQYEGECLNQKGVTDTLRCVVPYPANFHEGETARLRAKDYFGSWGPWSDSTRVVVVRPLTPDVTIDVNENGVAVFKWTNCRTYTDIRHYILEGASQGSTTGLSMALNVETIIWTQVDINGDEVPDGQYRKGALTEYVYAVDKYGFAGERGGQTFVIWPPYNPVIEIERRTDGLHLKWQDCKRTFNIREYIVKDKALNLTYHIDGTSQVLKPRAAGTYTFSVQAIDCIGSESSEMEVTQYLGGVGAIQPPELAASIDGSDVLLGWSIPSTSWPIDHYVILDSMNRVLGRAKTTYFRFPAPVVGSYEYGVYGVDVAGNNGPRGQKAELVVNYPAAPEVTAALAGDGVSISWVPGNAANTLPVVAWDVVRQWETEREDDHVIETHEYDYGRLDVTSLTIGSIPMGSHTFLVRAIDTSGNVGPWGYVDFDVSSPGKVAFYGCSTVDNNVLLYWTVPDEVFFPIEYYLFEEIERYDNNEEYSMEIGRIDALFASTFETKAGTYVYGVTPVDTAGNRGQRTVITMQVAQPPDFVMYHNSDSLFNGTKTNFVLDGRGNMLGIYADKTWQANLDEMAAAKSVTAADITWSQKIGWNWEYWLDPSGTSATYIEVVDVGTLIPSTKITVTIDKTVLAGSPVLSCKIEVSDDNSTWRTIADDAFEVYATSFRYVRYTIGLTGGNVAISNINYKLAVKRKTDFGHVHCESTDNGNGWTSMTDTPMLTGTWVPFNVAFTDVESLPKPNVVNHKEYTAYTVFEDVLNPQGFRIFVLDGNGNRVTADVDWSAFGV